MLKCYQVETNEHKQKDQAMKTSRAIAFILVLAVVGGCIWLLRSSDAKHLQRQDVVIDVPDTFEK